MFRLGLVPAAGTGSRWGGFYKELLPCGNGEWLLDRTLQVLKRGNADAALIVTSQDKLPALSRHLADPPLPLYFAIQRGHNDIWSAIEESFAIRADLTLFAMPDTYLPLDAFGNSGHGHFGMGTFETNRPDRFGVLYNGRVVNKQQLPDGFYNAWGVLSWSGACVDFWRRHPPGGYTDAINLALGRYDPQLWQLAYYHDMASWADYTAFVRNGGGA